MSTQVLLDLPDEVYTRVHSVAARTRRNVADVLMESITRSFLLLPVDPGRSEMSRNVAAFNAMHTTLVTQYLNQTVAICDGEVVDSDIDPIALLQRVRSRFPSRVVLRRKVEPVAEREIIIRHPRIEKPE